MKEEYADCLFLCRHCRSLFWKQIGHPCLIAQMLEEMNKENSDAQQFLTTNNENNLRSNADASIRIQERLQVQASRPINPLINNQIDLNRQINQLNRVNNNINDEINRQANDENNDENRFIPKMSDSIPITPEAFLKFFSL